MNCEGRPACLAGHRASPSCDPLVGKNNHHCPRSARAKQSQMRHFQPSRAFCARSFAIRSSNSAPVSNAYVSPSLLRFSRSPSSRLRRRLSAWGFCDGGRPVRSTPPSRRARAAACPGSLFEPFRDSATRFVRDSGLRYRPLALKPYARHRRRPVSLWKKTPAGAFFSRMRSIAAALFMFQSKVSAELPTGDPLATNAMCRSAGRPSLSSSSRSQASN
mmetsp:Transcript_16187/g.50071  ORF Transcript_16187/g.50071 Transcript_16187/m.50071 type:complete len:218 (-) Transcript_16187:1621-2274(-)